MLEKFIYPLLFSLFLLPLNSYAQVEEDIAVPYSPEVDSSVLKPDTTFMWHYADYDESGYAGISLNKAYEFAKDKNLTPNEIIVAVIDAGCDTGHVDLKDNLWVNPGEIPGNLKDDDNNGYVDDVHGWNFAGGPNNYVVDGAPLEITRLYRKYKKEFKNKSKKDIPEEKRKEFEQWTEIRPEFLAKRAIYKSLYENYTDAIDYYNRCEKMLAHYLKNPNFTPEDVESIEPVSKSLEAAKEFYLAHNDINGTGIKLNDMIEQQEYYDSKANKQYNVLYDPRKKVGDNPDDINDSLYGNNVIFVGKGSSHGTGVSGIIGAVRDNNIGIDGIAPKVKLMIVRVVPGGDERDKDVALGIRYAVKMGARIINCSFGKDYSPHKEFVDDAVRFARKNDVLIIHAAGNDSRDIDKGKNYPTKKLDNPEETAENWIEVGASNRHPDDSLLASFSNYGMIVDIFAPGVDIYSTDNYNKYRSSSGTSDASPVVSGVAALVLSYFPDLSATELKNILLSSATDYSNLKVRVPGKYNKKKKFKKLCSNPKVVNAYQALVKAYEEKGG